MVNLKPLLSGVLLAIGFFGTGWMLLFAFQSINNVSDGSPLTVSLVNDLIRKTNGIDYDTGELSINGTIKFNQEMTSVTCDGTSAGSIAYSGGSFYGCNGTGWQTLYGSSSEVQISSIILNGDARQWSDNSYAMTCNDYINPSYGYEYSGQTGSGYYWIDPDGNGTSFNPFVTFCDMEHEGGGWTLVYAILQDDSALAVSSGVTSKFPSFGDWTTLQKTDGVNWGLSYLNSSQWIVAAQPGNTSTISASKLTSDSDNIGWAKFSGVPLGQNNITVEVRNGATWVENDWYGWDTGYNGNTSSSYCMGHIRWYDYSNSTTYMPAIGSTGCVSQTNPIYTFWAR